VTAAAAATMRRLMRRPLLLVLVLLLVPCLAGCGGSSARSTVKDAQKSLADVNRATLHLKLALRTPARTNGFQLDGAFSFAPGEGPLADAVYRPAGGAPLHVLFDRTHGTIRTGSGSAAPLSPALLAELETGISGRTTHGIATYVQASKWVTEPKLTTEGGLDRVTGGVDVSRAASDLLEIAALSGYPSPQLTAADVSRLSSLVASSSFDLTATHDGHVLRRLALHFTLKPEARNDPVARLLGTEGTFVIALDRVGEPVRVPAS
jgi:hypothetical protein